MMSNNAIDWNAKAAQFTEMTNRALYGALADIRKTLSSADAMDRENGTDRGGYYRDEASIIWAEFKKRGAVAK